MHKKTKDCSQIISNSDSFVIFAAIECEPLDNIANGFVTYAVDNVANYSVGTVATYSCNTGFFLDLSDGSETRTCVDDGMDTTGIFDGYDPTCLRKLTIIFIMIEEFLN